MNINNTFDTSFTNKPEVNDNMSTEETSPDQVKSSRKSTVMLSNYRLQTHVTVKKFKELFLAGELNDNIIRPKNKGLLKDCSIGILKKTPNSIKQECSLRGMIKLPSRKKFQIGAQDKFEMAKFSAGDINFNSLTFTMTTNSCFIHNEPSEELLKFIIPFIPSQQTHTLTRIDGDCNEIYEIEIKIPHSSIERIYPDSTRIKLDLADCIDSDCISLIEDSEELIEFKKNHREEVYQHYLKQVKEKLSCVSVIEFTLMKAHMVWMNYLLKIHFPLLQRTLNMEANNRTEVRKFLKNNLYGYSPARRVTKSVTKFSDIPIPYLPTPLCDNQPQENYFNVKITKNMESNDDGKNYRIWIENNNSFIDVTYQVMADFIQLKHIDGIPLKIRFEGISFIRE
uniref:SWIB domain-containing protein n=1 Tax=Strongyloides papillosus TaxID=174720 RepID=A0A0N5CHB9_STREA